jgi:LysM repeat protein
MTRFVKATYHSNVKAAEFIAEDGRHCIRSGGSLPWRTNNAGNLVSPLTNGVPTPKKTKGFIGFAQAGVSNHHFFIFPDYETGRGELKASLKRQYADKTLEETIKKYAPATDSNDTERYINDLSKMSGVDRGTKIKDINEEQLNAVMDGIEKIEGYHANADSRKETWVDVSHIQATDGTRPVAGEEIVVKSEGKETILKSNAVGKFPAIVHGKTPIEVHHKAPDGTLKKVGQLPVDKGQHFSLINSIAKFFGTSGPVKAPEDATKKKHPIAYTVQPGDNLGKIAVRFQTKTAKIKDDNHLVSDAIIPGQVLTIHGSSPMTAPPAAKPKKALPREAAAKREATADTAPAKPKPKPKPVATPETQTLPARSKEGAGEPLALFTPQEGVAPWMKYAVDEAMLRKGMQEWDLEKIINYHKEINDGLSSLVGSNNAWCAAFVNWCLMKSGYAIENPQSTGFVDRKAAKGRAHGFKEVRGAKSDEDQKTSEVAFVDNPLFNQIYEPLYGAIVLVANSSGHGHHAGLVYAKIDEKRICILGGNQDQRIKVSPWKIKTKKEILLFFWPAAYKNPESNSAGALPEGTPDDLNKAFGIPVEKKKKKKGAATSTR